MLFINLELYNSEINLLSDKFKEYISKADKELVIISPYIKTDVLEELLLDCKVDNITIITTWKLRDLQFGSSELQLYEFCKKKNIHLFLNQRIHLKTLINDYSSCIFGSANISKRGLAFVDIYNYELAGKIDELDIDLIIYFKKILHESMLVNDTIYERYKEELSLLKPLPNFEEPNITKINAKSEFLISALPMSRNIDELYMIYSNNYHKYSKEKVECAIHDILLYNIPLGLSKEEFHEQLKNAFFESKFIIKLIDFIDEEKYFGRVKEWIQNNCEDVPVPSRRDLTGNIQVLYKWIVELSNEKYQVDRPNYSERIYRVK